MVQQAAGEALFAGDVGVEQDGDLADDTHSGGVVGVAGLYDDGGVLAAAGDVGGDVDVVSDFGGGAGGEFKVVLVKAEPGAEGGIGGLGREDGGVVGTGDLVGMGGESEGEGFASDVLNREAAGVGLAGGKVNFLFGRRDLEDDVASFKSGGGRSSVGRNEGGEAAQRYDQKGAAKTQEKSHSPIIT